MSKSKRTTRYSEKHKPSQREIDDALAALISSTRRKNRKLSPLEVVEKIDIAKEGIGSLPRVAQRIGLSYEMLREIYSLRNCSERVKRLIGEGRLNSYDILYRLSKLPASDQFAVAKAVIAGDLNSEDVRAIATLRKDLPVVSIRAIIDRIKASRNIKQYIAYFALPSQKKGVKVSWSSLKKAIGKQNIISIQEDSGVVKLVLNVEGKRRLQEEAKSRRLTKREFIQNFIVEA